MVVHEAPATEERGIVVDHRPEAVRTLFADYPGAPLAAYAEEMVQAADGTGIDWRLLPIISVLESGAGANGCGYNAWGWNSCRGEGFESYSYAIQFLATKLSEPPYLGLDFATTFCMWVAGNTCGTDHALNYRDKALWLANKLE
jgi:hypothetical protein